MFNMKSKVRFRFLLLTHLKKRQEKKKDGKRERSARVSATLNCAERERERERAAVPSTLGFTDSFLQLQLRYRSVKVNS